MREQRQDNLVVTAFVIAVVAVVVAVIGVGFGMRAVDESKGGDTVTAAASAKTPTVSLAEMRITPASVVASVDGKIKVKNVGQVPHNLAVDGTDVRTEVLGANQEAELDLAGLAPGRYKLLCEVPGHAAAGMTAELEIKGGGAGATAAATHGGHHSAEDMDETMAKAVKAFPAKTEGTGGQPLAPTVLPDGTKRFDLTAKVVDWEVEPGKRVKAMTYNGTVPGPTLKVEHGDRIQVVLKNELPESTAIHFHGLHTPNAMDGVPDITQPPIKPGATFTYEWVADGPAVGMYHSHHNAAKQVPDGLAGTILVGRVPLPPGVTIASEQSMMLNDAGTIGFSLNGKSFPATAPYAAKQGERILVHYLNEGVMAHPMHLHGLDQLVVAKDGFPLERPYKADTVNVAPGERWSVLVEAKTPGVWAWHCHILPHAEREDGMFGMVTALVVQ